MLQVGTIALYFVFGGPTGRDDADDVVEAFGADDHDEATADRSDADKAVLGIGMELVENLKTVDIICEELGNLLEGDAMILLGGSRGWVVGCGCRDDALDDVGLRLSVGVHVGPGLRSEASLGVLIALTVGEVAAKSVSKH